MISELTVQHAYIEGGDFTIPPRPRVALPGARFELDKAAGRYRITKIFAGQNEEPIYRAPLTEIGVNVAVGRLPAGHRRRGTEPGRRPLPAAPEQGRPAGAAHGQLQADVRGRPDGRLHPDHERETSSSTSTGSPPTGSAWTTLSGGRIGYLHIPDMGAPGHPRVHQVVLRPARQGRRWSSTSAPTAAATSRG